MGLEQRRHKRVALATEVLVDEEVVTRCMDVSEGGLYLLTPHQYEKDGIIKLRFNLGEKEMRVRARVKCCHESIGIGVSFVDLDVTDRYYIKGFLAERDGHAAASGRKRVLLVDDDECMRRMNKSKLLLDGMNVVEASNGIEAIGKLRESVPDMVVLDLYMEKMDGYKVLAYIKGSDDMRHIPVLVLSGRSNMKDMERVMESGADGYMVKMVTSPVKLSEQVRKMLSA